MLDKAGDICYNTDRKREVNLQKKGKCKMTKAEIRKRIEEIENKRFCLAMKDRWNANDYATDANWLNELRELNKALAEIA